MNIIYVIALIPLLCWFLVAKNSCHKCGKYGARTGARRIPDTNLVLVGHWCQKCYDLPVTDEERM